MLLVLVSESSFRPMSSSCPLNWLRSWTARRPKIFLSHTRKVKLTDLLSSYNRPPFLPPEWRHLSKPRRSCTERSPCPRRCSDAPPGSTAAESPEFTQRSKQRHTILAHGAHFGSPAVTRPRKYEWTRSLRFQVVTGSHSRNRAHIA